MPILTEVPAYLKNGLSVIFIKLKKTARFLQSKIGWFFGNPALPFTGGLPCGLYEANSVAFQSDSKQHKLQLEDIDEEPNQIK